MALVTQPALASCSANDWHQDFYRQLALRLAPPSSFPCLFSQGAFKRGLLLFSFVESIEESGIHTAAKDLEQYVDISKDWNGNLNSAQPLIMAFSKEVIDSQEIDQYHTLGWKLLSLFHAADPAPWPAEVASSPHLPFWSMCFNGMQLFINMSCPAHVVRKSRVLGEYFVLVINPREIFDIVAGDTPEGRKIRSNIRRRIEAYDGVPHCLQLGSYEAGEIEWSQYGIIEENADRTDCCPFRAVVRETGGGRSHQE